MLAALLSLLLTMLVPLGAVFAAASAGDQPQGYCPMCQVMGGGTMWVGLVLVWLLIAALIGVLVALAVYLFRRSRPGGAP